MNALVLLLVEALMSVALSLAVLSALSRPLMNALRRICPDEPSAAFWLSYAKVMLIIAPLLLVLAVDLFSHAGQTTDRLRLAFVVALAGLLLGLYSMGKRMSQFVTVPQKSGGAS